MMASCAAYSICVNNAHNTAHPLYLVFFVLHTIISLAAQRREIKTKRIFIFKKIKYLSIKSRIGWFLVIWLLKLCVCGYCLSFYISSFGTAFYNWSVLWISDMIAKKTQVEQIHRPLKNTCWIKSNSKTNSKTIADKSKQTNIWLNFC